MESRSGLIVDALPHLGACDAGARAGYRRRSVVAVLLGADTGSNAADFATVNVPRSWPSASLPGGSSRFRTGQPIISASATLPIELNGKGRGRTSGWWH